MRHVDALLLSRYPVPLALHSLKPLRRKALNLLYLRRQDDPAIIIEGVSIGSGGGALSQQGGVDNDLITNSSTE